MIPAIVVAVLIDRLCTRHRMNSTPYQFASLAALAGEVSVLVTLNAAFPRPVTKPFPLSNDVAEAIGWIVAATSGFAGSLGIYIYLRSRLLRNSDYDDRTRPMMS
jgi:hypothetical protein